MKDNYGICDKCRMIETEKGKWWKPTEALKRNIISKEEFNKLNTTEDGYLTPDPNCEKCKGEGTVETKVVFGEEGGRVFAGVCPICSEINGIAWEYPSKKIYIEDCRPSICLNKECSNYRGEIEWVNERDLI